MLSKKATRCKIEHVTPSKNHKKTLNANLSVLMIELNGFYIFFLGIFLLCFYNVLGDETFFKIQPSNERRFPHFLSATT